MQLAVKGRVDSYTFDDVLKDSLSGLTMELWLARESSP